MPHNKLLTVKHCNSSDICNDRYKDIISVETIPNFPLNRALGLTLTYNEKCYKIVGVHLKSLYDHNYKKDVPEQLAQLAAVQEWIGDTDNSIVCGDLNNTPGSLPIQKMGQYGYTDIIDSDKYVPSIMDSTNTEFHGKDGKESGSRIDYIFTKNIKILDYKHIDKKLPSGLWPSDHLPILITY